MKKLKQKTCSNCGYSDLFYDSEECPECGGTLFSNKQEENERANSETGK